jgi:hypothetical protein
MPKMRWRSYLPLGRVAGRWLWQRRAWIMRGLLLAAMLTWPRPPQAVVRLGPPQTV